MDNDHSNDIALPLIVCTRLERKFALSRCWFEPFPGRIYIRYATGLDEYLTIPQALAILG